MTTINNLPLLSPIRVIVAAGTSRTISFRDEFLGNAVALALENQDAANAATYRYNGATNGLKNLPASSFRSIDNTEVYLLEINAGAAGAVVVEGQILPIKLPEIPERVL